jgi:nitrate reductase gamma subunit
MRVIRNAKRVSVLGGGVVVVAASFGLWRAAMLLNENENGRVAAFTAGFAAMAFIQGCVILFWDRRSAPSVLMRPQPADALLAILPAAVIGSVFAAVPELRDPASPPFWLLVLFLGSLVISVKPAESALLSEVPPRDSMSFLDWVRSQNFGIGTLLITIWFTGLYLTTPLRVDAWTLVVITLALAQGAVSIWRIVEQHQMSRRGLRLSGTQIIWLRALHVNQGHEAAVKELRAMYPKIGTTHAERVIENLYQTEEER